MLIRKLRECKEIIAGDNSRLRELLHPDRDYQFEARYSLAHAVVEIGRQSLPHRLKSNEVYFILQGRGIIHIDEETAEVEPGDAIEIPPNSTQWIENKGDAQLEFLCIVDPAWRAADESV